MAQQSRAKQNETLWIGALGEVCPYGRILFSTVIFHGSRPSRP
jgi:hypothetical protein